MKRHLIIAVGLLGMCAGLHAQAPLNISESGDFPSHYGSGVYSNAGTLGLGTNVISGAVSGQPQGITFVGDFDDSFSVTLPNGLLLSKIQLTINNYDFGNTGGGGCGINSNGVSPSGVFGMPTLVIAGTSQPFLKCMSGSAPSLTYTFAVDFTPQSPGTYPVYFASPYNPTRLSAGAYSYSISFITVASAAPITITTPATLPPGAVGTLYTQLLHATGGTTYTWQLVSGSLPPGLGLSTGGTITGTPTTPGTFTFIARAVDNGSFPFLSAQQTFSLTVSGSVQSFSSALRIPQIVDGGGWKTLFAIVNIDQQPVNYTFRFWSDAGTALPLPILNGTTGLLSGTLAPGATAFAETPGTSPDQLQGWAEVTSAGRVGVTAIFRFTSGGTDSQGTANGILSGSSIFMPFDNTQGFTTGLAMANSNPTDPVTVSIAFQSDTGAQTTGIILLPPHGHVTFVVPTAFPTTANNRGSVKVTATSADIALLGLRFTPNLSFTSLGTFQ